MTTENKTLKENYELLKSTVDSMNSDFEKFNNKKIKVAGSRFRNNLLNCKKLCDKLRKQVTENISTLPIKHRTQREPQNESSSVNSPSVAENSTTHTLTPVEEVKEETEEESKSVKCGAPSVLPERNKIKKKRTRKANKPKEIKV